MSNTWIMHPGVYIKEEMDARGWIQRDLAFILGVPEQGLNMILSGKRGISPDMAKALGKAFDVPPEFFANLQQAYDLANAREPNAEIGVLGKMHANYPLREMINRGWLQKTEAVLLEEQLMRFFNVRSVGEIPYMPHAAKKSSYEEREVPPAQLAWLFRVRQIAQAISVPPYSEAALRSAIGQMPSLMLDAEGTREVPRLLMECGVKFILVEKLPNAKIDGVCFWIGDTPVVGMSIQRDTIDNFWFVLRHELEHVLRKHGRSSEIIDVDVHGTESVELPQEEQLANDAALEFSVTSKFDSFLVRKKPFYYERDVIAFARVANRHPGIIVGQMQRRMNNYSYLTRHLAKVRQFVLPGAIADGWGQVLPISM
jgi:HTH-type transcriptional regulator / antitoxin HigA